MARRNQSSTGQERAAQHTTAQPTVGSINRLSPMNRWAFSALITLYPLYMARLKDSRFKRYAMGIREIRQIAREDNAAKITKNDVSAVCHMARLGYADDLKAMAFIKGALGPVLNERLNGVSVREIIQADFSRSVDGLHAR